VINAWPVQPAVKPAILMLLMIALVAMIHGDCIITTLVCSSVQLCIIRVKVIVVYVQMDVIVAKAQTAINAQIVWPPGAY